LKRLTNIAVPLELVDDLHEVAARELGIERDAVRRVEVLRRSIDARQKVPRLIMSLGVLLVGEEEPTVETIPVEIPEVANPNKRVVIVGAGPAGLFAALRFADAGVPVTVLERGGAMDDRNKRARTLRADGVLDPECNLCFGEGGAGTYSDGKLYTRKRSKRVKRVYSRLVQFGASPEILVDAHPHIGTNRIIPVITTMREWLKEHGVCFMFDTRMDDLIIENNRVRGVSLGDSEIEADAVVLATGHSARDTYIMLAARGVAMTPKPFAVGARVEHPQSLINRIQFGAYAENPSLGAAEYFLSCQIDTRGVYSFCMCPGGFIIPTPTEIGHLNVNGMSNQSRKNHFANAALVATLEPEDFAPGGDALEGLEFQRAIERQAFEVGGGNYSAPATRLTDFVAGRASSTLPARSSYRPHLTAADIGDVLPDYVSDAIRLAVKRFESRMRGYLSDEAVIVAAETTTSSPIRLERGDDLQSITVQGLYPTGEGAGYAGGIVTSAIDGMRVAEQILMTP
jgi:uncharacterized FAD-dependent dehydrogenase